MLPLVTGQVWSLGEDAIVDIGGKPARPPNPVSLSPSFYPLGTGCAGELCVRIGFLYFYFHTSSFRELISENQDGFSQD